jgi:hypothetical protein
VESETSDARRAERALCQVKFLALARDQVALAKYFHISTAMIEIFSGQTTLKVTMIWNFELPHHFAIHRFVLRTAVYRYWETSTWIEYAHREDCETGRI